MTDFIKSNHYLRYVLELLGIVVGCAITAVGINELIVPAKLLSGGLTGFCLILNRLFGWSVGTQYLIFNIPLLILGLRYIGKKFSLYTIFGVLILSGFLNLLHFHHPWTNNPLLAAIFGGIISSAGSGLVLRCGGSTGGLDIAARVVSKFRNISVAKFNLGINVLIIVISAILFEVEAALYTLISIYASAKTYELILNHVDRISVVIVTEKGEAVSGAITKSMVRGVTIWDASGAYTHKDKQVLLCVIVNIQLHDLQQIIFEQDSQAFVTIIPTRNVVGKFNQIW